jgi:hypothetical protein
MEVIPRRFERFTMDDRTARPSFPGDSDVAQGCASSTEGGMTFRVLTGYDLFSDSTGCLLEVMRYPDPLAERQVVTSMTIETVKPGELLKPSFNMHNAQVHELFDQLRKQGYRPKVGTGNGGHLDAIKYHLEDMRNPVFERVTDNQ